MSPSPPPSEGDPRAAATAAPWPLAAAVASLICGLLSLLFNGPLLLLAGLLVQDTFVQIVVGALLGASFVGIFILSIACGVIGVVLGHLARRTAPSSRGVALATAGLVLSYGGTLLYVALYAFIISAAPRPGP